MQSQGLSKGNEASKGCEMYQGISHKNRRRPSWPGRFGFATAKI